MSSARNLLPVCGGRSKALIHALIASNYLYRESFINSLLVLRSAKFSSDCKHIGWRQGGGLIRIQMPVKIFSHTSLTNDFKLKLNVSRWCQAFMQADLQKMVKYKIHVVTCSKSIDMDIGAGGTGLDKDLITRCVDYEEQKKNPVTNVNKC